MDANPRSESLKGAIMHDPNHVDSALESLRELNDLQPIPVVAAALRAFAQRAAPLDEMSIVLLRNEAVAMLKASKISKPARLVDTALREKRRGKTGHGTAARPSQGANVPFADPEPWQERVDASTLITELVEIVHRYVQVKPEAAIAITLWVLHAHCIEAAHCSPRLAIVSPTKRCGKTTLLRILGALTPRPLPTANVTAAVLFRVIEAHHPTLLIDEADAFARDNDELRGVINAGHGRDGNVMRCVGEDHEMRAFAVFGPLAIAAIGKLSETIMDRSIVIEMHRKASGDAVERLRRREIAALEPLCRRCARWAADNTQTCAQVNVTAQIELHDRAADNWEPLLAIAAVLGDKWPSLAKNAALVLSGVHDASEGLGDQLLSDIRDLLTGPLAGVDPVPTQKLLNGLVALDDRPWQDFRGKPLNGHGLARMLRPFHIVPRTCRVGLGTPKVYRRADFEDAFARYLSAQIETIATTPGSQGNVPSREAKHATDLAGRRSEEDPNDSANVSLVLPPRGEPQRVRRVM